MLVLRRSLGQSIVIGKNKEIIIKILRDDNGVIHVGVDAPKSIQVDRLEKYEEQCRNISSNDLAYTSG